MNDAKGTARFKARLDEVKIAGATLHKVEAPPPDVADQWISWQVRGDVSALRDFLGQGKEAKK